ncbi:unnamed protein product [marine sediment metagenome]|uniref:Uncharacterized protein n=1 Tax=marine sediment metagenome TaxID=412755 RepID=X0SWH8_9ZZZZ
MDFILKKLQGGKNTVTLQELKEKLELARLKKDLVDTKANIKELQKVPKMDGKQLKDLISDDFLTKGEAINLINAASIEKDDKIKEGTVYYNNKLQRIRLKTTIGWVSLNIDK